MLNDDHIILNVTIVEEYDDDVKESVLDLKPKTYYSNVQAILSECIDWLKVQEKANIR